MCSVWGSGLAVCSALQHADVASELNDVASKDPAHRKLFVRGLAWDTDTSSLREVSRSPTWIARPSLVLGVGPMAYWQRIQSI